MKSNYPVFSSAPLLNKLTKSNCNSEPAAKHNWFINYCMLAVLLIMPFVSHAGVVYVTPTGAGNHNGHSWGNACTISEAAWDWEDCQAEGGDLNTCPNGIATCTDSLWLAKGTHLQWSIQGKSGITFTFNAFGGFAGNETSFSQRNPALNVTTILNQNGNGGNGTIQIEDYGCTNQQGANGLGNITLDGITFLNDHIYGNSANIFLNNCILNNFSFSFISNDGDLTATNCTFQNGTSLDVNLGYNENFTNCTFKNLTGSLAGGISGDRISCNNCSFDSIVSTNSQGSLGAAFCRASGTFQSCTFSHCTQTTPGLGGAISIYTTNGATNLTVLNCTFTNNAASAGGAIYSWGTTTVRDCIFKNNTATQYGGAILIETSSGTLTADNCLFVSNSAGTQGGAVYDVGSDGGNYYMNTFVNNTSPRGSALYTQDPTENLANNILYQNNGSSATMFVLAYTGANFMNNSNISTDGSLGPKVDPVFNFNYTLSPCSPAINAGNNGFTDGQTTDIAGNPRKYNNSTVDMGCYEFQGTPYGTPPISYVNLPNGSPHQTFVCRGNVILLEYNGNISGNSYSWYNNGVLDTTTSAPSYLLAPPSGDNVYTVIAHTPVCDLLSSSTSISVGPEFITPTLRTSSPPSGSPEGICPGVPLVVTANPGSGGESCPSTDSYQYSIDNGATYHPYTLGDTINTAALVGAAYVMATRTGCNCAASNYIASWGSSAITPTVTIAASAQVILAGQGVAFTATPQYAGSSPNYQWKQNGQNVGSNSNFYFANGVHNGDVFSCVLSNATNSTGCLYSTTATSNNITISVINDSASLSTTGPCVGSSVILSSQLNPEMIVWENNGNPVDTAYSGWKPNATTVGRQADTAPVAVFVDALGNTYVGYSSQVIKFAPGDTVGVVVAGYYQYQIQGLTALYVDGSGNVYVAEAGGVQKWISSTAAGIVAGFFDYSYGIRGLYVDQQGNVYTVDGWTSVVTKWLSEFNPVTVAGLHTGGSNAANDFQNPYGITFDGHGNMYIADYGNNRVQKWAPLADSGITVAGGNGPGNAANQLNGPTSVSVDQFGNLYINDSANFRIQMWKPGATSGITIAGGNGRGNGLNQFSQPRNSNMDIYGNLYVADEGDGVSSHGKVLKFSPVINDTLVAQRDGEYEALVFPFLNGQTNGTTLIPAQPVVITPASLTTQLTITANAGNEVCNGMGVSFTANPVNGGSNPTFQWFLNGLLTNATGPAYGYIGASLGDQITCVMNSNASCAAPLIDTSNIINLVPASTSVGISLQDGTNVCEGALAVFTATPGVAGTNYYYQWIKNGSNAGPATSSNTYSDATLIPGDAVSCIMYNTLPCASPTQAQSNSIQITGVYKATIAAPNGNCVGSPLFDNANFTPASTVWLENGVPVQTFPAQWNPNGITVAGGSTTGRNNEVLFSPSGVFVDNSGFIYASSPGTNVVQKWAPNDTGSTIVAGQYGPPGNGPAQLNLPQGVFVDAANNIYVADMSNSRVQKWAPGATHGVTVAGGNGTGNGSSQLGFQFGIFVDASGNVFVADETNNRIQKWLPGATSGITVAGTTSQFDSNFPDSYLIAPTALFLDASGNMYIADDSRVVLWPQGASSSTTLLGSWDNAGSGPNQLNGANGIWIDGANNIYVSDGQNNRIQVWLSAVNQIITAAGGNGTGNGANQLNFPTGVYVDLNGNIYVSDRSNNRVQEFNPSIQTFAIPAFSADTFTLSATAFNGCTVVSGPVIVNPLIIPGISISAQPLGTICANQPVTFTLSDSGEGTTPIYTWYKNGQPVSSANTYTDVFNNNDFVFCLLQSSAACVQAPVVQSNIITLNVVGSSSSIVINQSICSGASYDFNGRLISNQGTYRDTLTGAGGCDSIITLNLTVTPSVTPGVGLATTTGFPICQGSGANFSAQPTNGGTSPTYQWYVNGNPAGTNSPNYSSNTFNNNDKLYCVMTSNATCANPGTANTDTATITVTPLMTPSVSIAITGGSQVSCTGTPVTFTATPVNAGTSILYVFKVNGGTAQTGSSATFTTSTLNNNDSVTCSITVLNNHLCVTTTTANSNSVTMTVGVAPVITCPGTATLTTNLGLCSSSASIGTATYTGGCGNVTITHSPAGPYAVGNTTVTWKALDQNGDSSTCTQLVTVTDNELPTITCAGTVNVNTDAGHCYSSGVSLGTPVTNDNCGVLSVTNNAPSQYPVGSTTVIWTITDIHNNTNTCNQTVNVTDNELPTITCPATVNVTADADHCYASGVSLGTPVTNDNCGVLSVTNNAPSQYPVGSTTVIWTITDIHNNTNTCNQTVNVTDNELPTITCPATVNVTADAGHCYASGVSLGTPVTNDNCGVLSVTNNAPSQYLVGSTTVIWTITDIHNNTNTCNQIVNVTDNELPTITCPATVNVTADGGHCYASGVSLGIPVTNDNCGVLSVTNNAPSQYPVGSTTVIWTIIDIHNNTNTCNQTVNVTDNQLPTITCPATVNVTADAGHCYASGVSLGTPVTNDNCGVLSVTNNAPSQYPVGSTTVIWTITDIHNNTNTCNQIVNVTDNQVPVITCPAAISVTATQTVCNKALTIATPVTSDNCGIAAVKNSFNGTSNASGTYPVGTTNVVWTATDIHNLTATCTQVITIYPCINITGTANNTICVGTSNGSIAISVTGGNGAYTYHWNNGQTTANLSNLAAGNYTVTVSDASSGSATATFTVGTTVPAAKPATPGAISGLTQFCPNTTTTYSIGSVPYASAYTWSVPSNATIQSGQGTTQITVKFNSGFSSGTVSVLASNCKGNSNKSNLAVSVYTIPNKPVSIIGAATVCSGSTQAYSILSVNGATSYTWSVPSHCTIISGQGSTAVTVQYQTGFTSGNISVYATNCTGSSGVKSLGVGLEPVPNQPGTISGTSSICTGIVYQYLISAVTNASTYTWTVPTGATLLSGQGTTSITLQYTGTFTSGSVSVYASNCTGNGSVKSLAISKLTAPAQPSYVIGTTSVCPNETYQYQVGSVNNASSYTWTVPANATIVSGQGTTTLTVQYGSSFTGGTLSVYASDCAGNSSAKSIAISKATRGCGGTRMDEVDTTESSAATIIEPTDVDFKVILYPNPFASQCRLNITSPSTEPVTLRIYSITGQLIEERTEQFTGTDIIMGNSLASGLYLVEVKQQDRTKVLRFIKSE